MVSKVKNALELRQTQLANTFKKTIIIDKIRNHDTMFNGICNAIQSRMKGTNIHDLIELKSDALNDTLNDIVKMFEIDSENIDNDSDMKNETENESEISKEYITSELTRLKGFIEDNVRDIKIKIQDVSNLLLSKIDFNNYKNWNAYDVRQYILHLNPEFKQYNDILTKKLIKTGVNGKTVNIIDRHDVKELGINNIEHQKQIVNGFKRLKSKKYTQNMAIKVINTNNNKCIMFTQKNEFCNKMSIRYIYNIKTNEIVNIIRIVLYSNKDANANIEYELYYNKEITNKKMDVLKSRKLAINTNDINPPSRFHALSNITLYFDQRKNDKIVGIHCEFIQTTNKTSCLCKCIKKNKNNRKPKTTKSGEYVEVLSTERLSNGTLYIHKCCTDGRSVTK